MSDLINVKTYGGAVGDGITDDTLAIQNTIDYCAASGNRFNVYFPPGQYAVTSLQLKDRISLIGVGRNRAFLKHTAAGILLYNPLTTAIGNILIQDLSINFNTNTTRGIDCSRVYMTDIIRVNIMFNGATSTTGIFFGDGVGTSNTAYYNTCYDVSINGNDGAMTSNGIGFHFEISANSNRIMNCRTNYVATPINILTPYLNQIVVTGCAFENFITGIICNGTGCSFIGNRFENGGPSASGTGIQLTATSTGNYMIGNFFTNVTTIRSIDPASGNNFIFDYSLFSTKYLAHEVAGGWTSNQNMRGYGIQQVGYMDIFPRTSALPNQDGRMFYANGATYDPGDGKGLYINDGSANHKIGYKRAIPATSTSAGTPGDYAIDDANSFYYICTAPNTWKRVALSTF
jgi:hypothetical protein